MVYVTNQENTTIEDYVNSGLEFQYIETASKLYNKPYDWNVVNNVLDDYNNIRQSQDVHYSKVNALRMFLIRLKATYNGGLK